MNIQITNNCYVNEKYFKSGEQYPYIGTEMVKSGCACNGSLRQYESFVVLINNVKYNIRTSDAVAIQ
ncbi:Uncharacterised protein [uncultured archaeon]|nr:Uncharacterised protein [uncultured archaeon]